MAANSIDTSIRVVGLKEALRDLNKLDKTARREVTRRFKEIVKPVIDDIQAKFPTNPPLSGFKRGWDPGKDRSASARLSRRDAYAAVLAKERNQAGLNAILPWSYNSKAVVANVSGKKPRSAVGRQGAYVSNLAVFRIVWKGPGARLFDTSGSGDPKTKQGQIMAASLTRRFGPPSRLMWNTYDKRKDEVEDALRRIVNDVMEMTNRDVRV